MKNAYRMYKRGDVYYIQNNETREQRSLGTRDKTEAKRLLDAENQVRQLSSLNREIGTAYLRHADPEAATRTWQEVMNQLSLHGIESSRERCNRAMRSKPFDIIRNKPIVKTTKEDLRTVLKRGGSATNNYLRRLHNLAIGSDWLPCNIIQPRQWEMPVKKQKRAISPEEHDRIIAAEQNEERRNYYQMLWEIGAAQTDGSLLAADNVNWGDNVLSYQRKKTGEWCFLRIGQSLANLLKQLPQVGQLFPKMSQLRDKDRSAEFRRRCRLLKIEGVSLHSYRYAWAERAYKLGYEERFAQAALGHKSRAVHYAYARKAKVICPSLEESENGGAILFSVNS